MSDVKWGMTAPHRLLRPTSPAMHGEDVKALQLGINKRGRDRGVHVAVDGSYGPETDAAADAIAYALGAATSTVRRDGATVGIQRIIRAPQTRTDDQLRRAAHRREHPAGPDRTLAWLRAQIGTSEHPANSNRGPKIDDWQAAVGIQGAPWCGALVHAGALAGGVRLDPAVRYVPAIKGLAQAGRGGYLRWVGPREIQPGDSVCFNFDGGVDDHVGTCESIDLVAGTVTCIEGNTSSTERGSQSNGGIVARRTRSLAVVHGAGRPAWPAA